MRHGAWFEIMVLVLRMMERAFGALFLWHLPIDP